jgi:hypothetical protein
MKYLKTYKIFETIGYSDLTDDIWEDIKDILIELHDDGFFISQDIFDVKKVGNKLCEDVIEIIIDKESKEGFSFKEIEEYTSRLIDYMSDWKWSLFYFDKYDYVEFESSDVLKNNLSTEAERMLYKSLVDKNIQNCIAFKIVFYKNISRVIKENKEDIDNIQSKEDIILTVKDILLEFEDNGYPVSVYEKPGATPVQLWCLVIEIGEESQQMIKLHEYELIFKHLFSYLGDMGYKIESNISYVTNNTWDYRILCPNCGSDRIIPNDIGQCEKCDFTDDLSKFNMDDTHTVSQGDLEYFIKNKYWVQFMYFYLKKY